jgi:hypothetical protein
MSGPGPHPAGGTVVRAMRSTVGRESTTFGFSVLVTATFGLLQTMEGTPDVPRIFGFGVGAVLSFTVLEAFLSRGFRRSMPQHGTRVLAIGTSLNVLSVVGGLGAAWLTAQWMSHAVVWALAPFVGALVYLVLESLETALGERVAARAGDDSASETTP